jgi:molybdate transport system substrate-binding protein
MRFPLFLAGLGLVFGSFPGIAGGPGEVHVAVAANFARPLGEIGAAFEKATGHRVVSSPGSTGKLHAQIRNGAPFDVLLAADAERPRLLEEEGSAVAGSRFPYALGRLVLWSAKPSFVDGAGPKVLEKALGTGFRHLAIANPKTAPYGAAARQVLEKLGLWQKVSPRIVQGEDIGQAFQFVVTGNAELGFVALSQLQGGAGGSRWLVPADLHAPIEQQAVLLARGRDNPAARAFLAFLKGKEGRAIVERSGYALP